MFGVSLREIAVATVGVALIFASLFLPPFYKDILLYAGAAIGVFMLVRWLLRRRKAPPQ